MKRTNTKRHKSKHHNHKTKMRRNHHSMNKKSNHKIDAREEKTSSRFQLYQLSSRVLGFPSKGAEQKAGRRHPEVKSHQVARDGERSGEATSILREEIRKTLQTRGKKQGN